jgi:uroporphyrinogen decarboxylase
MREMTPRERVLTAMRRRPPDRVPRELSWGAFTPALMEIFRQKTGADDPAEYFQFEVRAVSLKDTGERPDFSPYLPANLENVTIDQWGVARRRGTFFHFERMIHPLRELKTPQELNRYPFPEPLAPGTHEHLEEAVVRLHARELAVAGDLACTIFEISWYMRGMEQLLADLALNPDFAAALLDRVTEIRKVQARRLAQAGVDILRLGDDVSSQTGMLMSPATWRAWFKPRLQAVIDAARSVNPDLLIFYHSDGDCRAIVPELIEIGVDILNPVQPECMDPAEMKRQYGDRLAFWGTIGTQTTMPFGTPDEVKRVVRERIATVGQGGGLLLAPTHILEPDVPWENVLAFFEAIEETSLCVA